MKFNDLIRLIFLLIQFYCIDVKSNESSLQITTKNNNIDSKL